MRMGEMKVRMTKENLKVPDKKDEESDTEDSCELEITPEQLSQVVPGGGVLNMKIIKEKNQLK